MWPRYPPLFERVYFPVELRADQIGRHATAVVVVAGGGGGGAAGGAACRFRCGQQEGGGVHRFSEFTECLWPIAPLNRRPLGGQQRGERVRLRGAPPTLFPIGLFSSSRCRSHRRGCCSCCIIISSGEEEAVAVAVVVATNGSTEASYLGTQIAAVRGEPFAPVVVVEYNMHNIYM